MAFRYEGVNWEGRDWQTVPAVTTLGMQIEEVRPQSYPQDGTVASRLHDQVSPTSDHRPDSEGDVFAIDVGGEEGWRIGTVEALRLSKDERIRYLIHQGRIFSNYPKGGVPAFEWRPYSGASPHEHHFHVSVDEAHGDDRSSWHIKGASLFTDHEVEVLKEMVRQMEEGVSPPSNPGYVAEAIRLIRKERNLPLHEQGEAVAVDAVARTGVAANAVEINHVKETLRDV
ncbi:MAG: hypothetical protein JSW51_02145 [Gemmatimonadota bacterium]|nr:MAG: hypothetical protein JSW51_02145 [Gemmatimonadota bacterium]